MSVRDKAQRPRATIHFRRTKSDNTLDHFASDTMRARDGRADVAPLKRRVNEEPET
jgi:hypothetical protein